MHEVTVGLALPTSATAYLSSLRTYTFAPSGAAVVGDKGRGHTSMVLGARVIGGGTSAETLAVYAVDQRKSQQFKLLPSP